VLPDPRDGRGKLVRLNDDGAPMRQRCIEQLAPMLAELEFGSDLLAQVLPLLEGVQSYLNAKRSRAHAGILTPNMAKGA